MTRKICFFFILLISLQAAAQRAFTSDLIAVKNRFRTLRVIHADNNSYFLMDNRYKNLNANYSNQRVPTLYKFDNQSKVKFMKEYEKEFDGYEFGYSLFLKGSIYLFAHRYSKDSYMIYCYKISTEDGSVAAPIKEIAAIPVYTKKDKVKYNVSYTPDSSKFVLGVNIVRENATELMFGLVDEQLSNSKMTKINFTTDNDKTQLENVIIIDDKSFVLAEGTYDYVDAKKKRDREKYLKHYTLKKYTFGGKMDFAIKTSAANTFPLSAKGIVSSGKLWFAEFFSNKPGVEGNTNGLMVSNINLQTGKIESATSTPLSVDKVGVTTKDEDKGLGTPLLIKTITPNTALGGFVIIAELTDTYEAASSSIHKDAATGVISTTSSQKVQFLSSEILAMSVTNEGKLTWISQLPKEQFEMVSSQQPEGYSTSSLMNPWSFYYSFDYPLYSSYAAITNADGINLVINDHSENGGAVTGNARISAVKKFEDSETYIVTLDFKTGKFKRKLFNLPAESKAILMPKTAIAFGNSLYIASYLKKTLAKGEVVVSRIEFK